MCGTVFLRSYTNLLIVAQMWKQQTNNSKEFEHVNLKKKQSDD